MLRDTINEKISREDIDPGILIEMTKPHVVNFISELITELFTPANSGWPKPWQLFKWAKIGRRTRDVLESGQIIDEQIDVINE